MKVLTVGIIGCGSISKFHFSGLEKAGAKIKWVCDLNAQSAKPWVERFGARYTADYHEIIADGETNLIDVTAISGVHKEICLAAIDAGKAVICEKTLAENPEDAWAIVTRAQERGAIFYTSYMKRFIPAVEKAKELMPGLGRIMSSYWRTYQQWGKVWTENPAGFFHTPAGGRSVVAGRYGGGILTMGGSHILDLLLHFLGRPRRLCATMHTPEGRDYEVQACAMLETANGTAHFEALAHPLQRVGFLRDGWDERVEINGVNGRLEIYSSAWEDVTNRASLLVHYDNRSETATEYRFPPASPFDRAIAFFCDNIRRGEQGGQSALSGWEVDNLIEHIRASATKGQAVEVRWNAL
jgi:predicted dehydrogenase